MLQQTQQLTARSGKAGEERHGQVDDLRVSFALRHLRKQLKRLQKRRSPLYLWQVYSLHPEHFEDKTANLDLEASDDEGNLSESASQLFFCKALVALGQIHLDFDR